MKTVIDQINKIYDKFNKLNEWFIIFLMSAMCLDLLGQVIMRYVFQHPLTWSEELARYIFVWIALLGSAWCGRNHIHVRMTAVTSLLPKPAVHVIQILISIICAGTCFILFPNACKIFMSQSKLKAVTLGVSLGIEYIAAPIGIMMMAIQRQVVKDFFIKFTKNLKKGARSTVWLLTPRLTAYIFPSSRSLQRYA